MNSERLVAICVLEVMATVSFLASLNEPNDTILLIGSLFLAVELFLLGIGDRT